MLGLNSFYALLLLLSIPELWSHWHLAEDEHLTLVLGTEALPPLSILVPAYNEEMTIVDSVISFLTLQYPHHEVVLVNDGSIGRDDGELLEAVRSVRGAAGVHDQRSRRSRCARTTARGAIPKLLVIDKENGGKADALNAALNPARFPYVSRSTPTR